MKTPIKIALFDPIGNHGGMNYYDDGLIIGLKSVGIEVVLYSNFTSKHAKRSFPFFEKQWKSKNIIQKGLRFYGGFFRTIVSIKQEGLSLVHLHFFQANWRLASISLLFRAVGVKVVTTVHDVESFSDTDSGLAGKLINSCSAQLIVHNQYSRKTLEQKYPNLAHKIKMAPHGNYIPFILPKENKIRKERKQFSILFFGQIKEVKGLDTLLEGFSIFAKNHPNAQLTIAGKVWKADFSKYQAIIDSNGIADQCNLQIRYIPDDELPTLYAAHDLIVLPYKVIFQSGILLHSMSYQCPVLVSNLDPFLEIVKNKENGYIFERENPVDLALQLKYIFEHKDRLPQIASEAYSTIESQYSWKKSAELIKKIYEDV